MMIVFFATQMHDGVLSGITHLDFPASFATTCVLPQRCVFRRTTYWIIHASYLAKIKIIEINIMSRHTHNSHHNKGILKNGKPYRDFYPRWVGLSSRLLNENGYLINTHVTLSGVCVMVFVAPLVLRICCEINH